MIPIENVLVLNIDVLNGHHDYAVTYPVKKIQSQQDMVCILAQVSLTGPGLKPPQTLVVRLRKDHLPVETDQLKQDVTIKKEEDVLASLSAAQAKVQVKKVTVNTRKWSGLIAQPVSFLTKRVPSPLAHALKVRTPPSEVRVISPIVGYMIRRPDHEGRDRAFKRCKTC